MFKILSQDFRCKVLALVQKYFISLNNTARPPGEVHGQFAERGNVIGVNQGGNLFVGKNLNLEQ